MEFQQIYEANYQQVYHFLLGLTRNPHYAEELTQQTFFKALKRLHQFRGNCKISVWLCQIAKNQYYDDCKKKQTEPFDEQQELRWEDDPLVRLVKSEQMTEIHTVLHHLEEPYKEVFTLHMFAGLSYEEIASLFQKSPGWVRVTFYRAKEKMVKMLKECGKNDQR